MWISSGLTLFAVVFNHALAAPAHGNGIDLQERAAPAACANPLAVLLAYDILSILHATSFCTGFLGISTKTVSTTQTAVATASTTIVVTSTPIVLGTSTTTTVTASTTTIPTTLTAATSLTTVPGSTTVFLSITSETTSTQTTTSTSTTYEYDVNLKIKKRAAKPTKPSQLKSIADNIVSSACSCIATTPTVTTTAHASSTTTVESTSTSLTTSTSIASTSVVVSVSLATEFSTTTTTPLSTITSIATFTSTTAISTQTATATRTDIALDFIDVILQAIPLNGCTVGTYSARFLNIGASDLGSSGQICAAKCVAAGTTACDEFWTQQNLPSNTWDCFLLRISDEGNSNIFCNNPAIGQAADWLIIY